MHGEIALCELVQKRKNSFLTSKVTMDGVIGGYGNGNLEGCVVQGGRQCQVISYRIKWVSCVHFSFCIITAAVK